MSLPDHDEHDDFGGLHRDLLATGRKVGRRRLLTLAGGIGASFGALQLMGCGGDGNPDLPLDDHRHDRHRHHGTGTTGGGALCAARVPEETAGPFPGDGSNGPNVLPLTGAVRSDIRSSFAGLSGTADGVPLDDRAHDRVGVDVRAAGRPRRLHLALRSARPLLALQQRRHQPELPARRAGSGRQRAGRRSRRSSPPATPAAGRTSTSRSTRRWPRRRA